MLKMPGVGGACRNDLVVIPVVHSKSTIDVYVWFTLSGSPYSTVT